jgi:equilibrative nucleoside transporter 1/2/3
MFESPRLYLRKNEAASIVAQLHDLDPESATASTSTRADPRELNEACLLVMIVGVGYLFPFSALTQPVDYWTLLFPDFNIEFPLTTIYMWTNLIMLAILVFFGGNPHFTRRIVGGFVGQLIVLLIVPSSYFFHFDERANTMAVLGSTAVAAIVTAFIDSSVIALITQYPLRVQEYFQLGVGMSTLIGSLYRDATKLVVPADAIVESSLIYFYTGAATIAVCIAAYFRLMQLPLSKACLAKATAAAYEEVHHHNALMLPSSELNPLVPQKQPSLVSEASTVMDPERYTVWNKVLWNEFMVLLLFLSTLALWPPLVTEIPAYGSWTKSCLESTGWWSLVLLTIFSFSDCLGRLLVRHRMGLNKDNIWVAVTIRFVIVPLLVAQVQGWGWTSDSWSALLVGFLGLTNGYVGTLTIVMVNDVVDTSKEQAIAGTFTSFFLNSGLVLGATIGMVFDEFLSK